MKGTLAARLNDSVVIENNNVGYQVHAAPE
ncbi:MAG: OB-fold domain-containing protein, partial [Christensenellales bacterium]